MKMKFSLLSFSVDTEGKGTPVSETRVTKIENSDAGGIIKKLDSMAYRSSLSQVFWTALAVGIGLLSANVAQGHHDNNSMYIAGAFLGVVGLGGAIYLLCTRE
ncbi:MAG: hypothetical protein WC749_07755 [Dehalococcoidia bacterium]